MLSGDTRRLSRDQRHVHENPAAPGILRARNRIVSSSSETRTFRRHFLLRPVAIAAVASFLLIVVSLLGFALQRELSSTIPAQRFATYAYPAYKKTRLSVSFYPDSRIGNASTTTSWPAGQRPRLTSSALVSPRIAGEVPITLEIAALPTGDQSEQVFGSFGDCSPLAINGFAVPIPALRTKVALCPVRATTQSGSSATVAYYGTFASPTDGLSFLLMVQEESRLNRQYQMVSYLDLSRYQSDIRSIVSSLRPSAA